MKNFQLLPNEYLYRPIYLNQIFSGEECQAILDLQGEVTDSSLEQGLQQPDLVNYVSRLSKTLVLQLTPNKRWLYEKIYHVFHQVNTRYYRFQLDSFYEIHRLEYLPGGLFKWHSDLGIGKTTNRKLSFILFLNERQDYQGGQLEISQYNDDIPQNQGDCIVFPAYIPHQVTPITQGVRHVLVAWAYGPAFN